MKTTKTLALAALAALSLGIGAALAQEGGESGYNLAPAANQDATRVQSGSSDIDTAGAARGVSAQHLFRAEGQGF